MEPATYKEISRSGMSSRHTGRNHLASGDVPKKPVPSMKAATMQGAGMNALERLIKTRMAELGLTYEEAGKRGGMPATTIWQLANKPEHNRVPRMATMLKLAQAIDVPLDLLRSAAAEAAGYHIEELTLSGGTTLEGAENVRAVVAGMEKLSTAEQNRLRSIVSAYVSSVLAERNADEV